MRAPFCTLLSSLALPFAAGTAVAQAYPVKPDPLPDAEEIALAMTAAPAEISSKAAIYAVRGGREVVMREGTNGAACMVARDLHEGSLYPICFDAEGTRTRLRRELLELRLRMAGDSEEEVKRKVAEAYRTGALESPRAITVAYMLSPRQVLFSSPEASGFRVGAWWPHLMIMGPGLSAKSLGIPDSSSVRTFMVGTTGGGHEAELIVPLTAWSDGTPVKN